MNKKLLIGLIFILFPSFAFSDGWFYAKPGTASDTPIFTDENGFEEALPGNWDSASGSPTRQSSVVAKGSWAISTDAVEYMVKTLSSAQTEVWSDFWFRIDSVTPTTHQIWKLNATGGASWIYMSLLDTEELRVTDSTNIYDTGITLSADTWYHIFIHIELAAGGSEVVQVAVDTTDARGAWDYENAAATFVPADLLIFNYGRMVAPSTEIFYHDAVRIYGQATEPDTW